MNSDKDKKQPLHPIQLISFNQNKGTLLLIHRVCSQPIGCQLAYESQSIKTYRSRDCSR